MKLRRFIIGLLVAFMIVQVPFQVHAASQDDIIEDLIPETDGGSVDRIYDDYPLWNYTLDTDSGFLDLLTPAFMIVLNTDMAIQATAVRIMIMFLEQAYTLDLLKYLTRFIDTAITAYKASTWDVFFNSILIIIGVYVLFTALLSYRKSKSVEQLLATIGVIIIAVLFFAYPSRILNTVNDVSEELSGAVLTGTLPILDGQASDIDNAVIITGNQLWEQQVLYPWYLAEFGSISEGKAKAEKFLGYPKGDDAREENLKEEVDAGNWYMTEKGIYARMIILGMSHLLNLFILIIIAILSILMLCAQLVPLVLICLTPLVLTIALIPGFGLRLVYKLTERVIGASFFKVVISIFLSLYIVTTHVFASIFGDQYFLLLIVESLVVIALILERKRIYGLIAHIPKGRRAVEGAVEMKSNYGQQIGGVIKKGLELGLAAGALITTGGTSASLMAAGKGSSMMKGAMVAKSFMSARENQVMHPYADQLLFQRYHEQKDRADRTAAATGQAPMYSPFVKQVLDRQQRGLPLFTGDQQDAAIKEMRDIKQQGGDYTRLLNVPLHANDPNKVIPAHQRRQMEVQEALAKKHELGDFNQHIRRQQDADVNHMEISESESPGKSSTLTENDFSNERIDIEHLPAPASMQEDYQPVVPLNQPDREVELHLLARRAQRSGNTEQFDRVMQELEAFEKGKRQKAKAEMENEKVSVYPGRMDHASLSREASATEPQTDYASTGTSMPPQDYASLDATLPPQEENSYNDAAIPSISTPEVVSKPARRATFADLTETLQPNFGSQAKGIDASAGQAAATIETPTKFSESAPARVLPAVFSISEMPREEALQVIEAQRVQANATPTRYVSDLDVERKTLHADLKALNMVSSTEETELAIIPDIQVRAEQLMERTGSSSVQEAIAKVEKQYVDVSKQYEMASEHYQVAPKRYIEMSVKGEEVVTQQVRVKTPTEYYNDIFSEPISNLSFEVHKVDDAFRQSVSNDWFEQSQKGVSPEKYIEDLYRIRQNHFEKKDIFKKAVATNPEYSQMAKRSQALYVDATKRYEVAKEMLGVDDGRKKRRYRGKDETK